MIPLTRYLNRRRQAGISLTETLIATLIIFFIFLSILPLFARAKVSNKRGGESSKMNSFLMANIESVNQSSINHSSFNDQFNSQEELAQIKKDNKQNGVDKLEQYAVQLDDARLFSNTENYIGLPTEYYGTGAPEYSYDGSTGDDTPSTLAGPTASSAPSSEGSNGNKADAVLGDESWLGREEAENHDGRLLWLKDVALFNWDISDVNPGTVGIGTTIDDDGNEVLSVTTVGNRRLFDNPLKWSQDNPPDIREIRVFIRSSASTTPVTGTGMAMVLGYYRSF